MATSVIFLATILATVVYLTITGADRSDRTESTGRRALDVEVDPAP